MQVVLQKIYEIYDALQNLGYEDIPSNDKTGDPEKIALAVLRIVKERVSLTDIDTLETLGGLPKGIFYVILYMFIYRYYGILCPTFSTVVQYSLVDELQSRLLEKLEEYKFEEVMGWKFA